MTEEKKTFTERQLQMRYGMALSAGLFFGIIIGAVISTTIWLVWG